jgi:hypothetical protein
VDGLGHPRERCAPVIRVVDTLDSGAQLWLIWRVELNRQYSAAHAARRRDEPAVGCGVNGRLTAEQTPVHSARHVALQCVGHRLDSWFADDQGFAPVRPVASLRVGDELSQIGFIVHDEHHCIRFFRRWSGRGQGAATGADRFSPPRGE